MWCLNWTAAPENMSVFAIQNATMCQICILKKKEKKAQAGTKNRSLVFHPFFSIFNNSPDWNEGACPVELSHCPPSRRGHIFPACVSNQPCRRAEEPAACLVGLELWFQSAGGRDLHAVRLTFSATNNTCPAIHLSKSQPVSDAASGLRDGQQTEGELRSVGVHHRFPPLFSFFFKLPLLL